MPEFTLHLGDCLDVLKSLPDGSVDAVVTDPPYGVGFRYDAGREVADNPDDYWAWLRPIYERCIRVLRPGGFVAVWNAHKNFPYFWRWFGDDIQVYAACKNFVQMRKAPFQLNGYDPVVMRYNAGTPLRPMRPRRNLNYFVANTAGIVSDPTRPERGHPCPRPLDAVTEVVDNFALPGGTILDPFMGSGTTGVACMNTGRNFIGIEIDKGYYDIAQRRIAEAKFNAEAQLIPA